MKSFMNKKKTDKKSGGTAPTDQAGNQMAMEGMDQENRVTAYRNMLAQSRNSERVEEALQSGSVPQNLDQEKTLGTDWLLAGAMQGMQSSKKYGFKKNSRRISGSSEYKRVENLLTQILETMGKGFSESGSANKGILRDIIIKYQQLDDACDVYLKKEGGKSATGKQRKEQVRMIRELVKADHVHLQYLAFDAKEEELSALSGKTWGQILDEARAGAIEVEDLKALPAFGNEGKQGDNAGRILDAGMFTRESILEDLKGHNDFAKNAFSSYSKAIFNEANKTQSIKEKEGHSTELCEVYGIQPDEKINMSNRNVAMSRIANMLGIGDVIEQSKTVRVKDWKGDMSSKPEILRGNLMTKAKGVEAAAAIQSISEGTEEAKGTKYKKDMSERENTAYEALSPMIQKELSSLQVLDYLCGQGDRHFKNFFMEKGAEDEGMDTEDKKKSRFEHVHGIDNDNAFSTGVDQEAIIKERGYGERNLCMVVDSDNNLMIPHMDAALAESILNITDEEIEYALKDLIEPKYIEYTKQRFQKTRAAIKKEQSKENEQAGSKKLLKDGEWNRKTHDDFMAGTLLYRQIVLKNRAAGKAETDESQYGYKNSVCYEDHDIDTLYERMKENSYYAELVLGLMGRKASYYDHYFDLKE